MLTVWVIAFAADLIIIAWALVSMAKLIGRLERKITAFQQDDNLDDRYSRGVSLAVARLARRVDRLEGK